MAELDPALVRRFELIKVKEPAGRSIWPESSTPRACCRRRGCGRFSRLVGCVDAALPGVDHQPHPVDVPETLASLEKARKMPGWEPLACFPAGNEDGPEIVFTIPRMLRGIFRKRRKLLTLLFHTATETLRDAFRARHDLPDGRIAAVAAVHSFGDYLIFHPHLHVLAADGLFDKAGRFHCMPAESAAPVADLFRHRFLHALREAKLISPRRLADLLGWKHSSFHLDHGPKPVAPHDIAGRKHLAEYLLRMPFSLQKIHWNETSKTVIYRSRRHWRAKRNFEIFPRSDFLAAAVQHIPPKGQQTVCYYGLYSNKSRGLADTNRPMLIPAPAPVPLEKKTPADEILLVPGAAETNRPCHAPALARPDHPGLACPP